MIYETSADTLPDSRFEPGRLEHIVVGNEGRALDPRRTPVRVSAIRPATGHFLLEILAFEDRGACWELPYECVDRFQFALGSAAAKASEVAEFAATAARLGGPLAIEAREPDRAASEARIAALRADVARSLQGRTGFLALRQLDPSARTGIPELGSDLERFLRERDLWSLEEAFASRYVRYPHSGELVKGHRIVLAELGLVPYDGRAVRDPALFDGDGSKPRRAAHILHRLAFVREVFERSGLRQLVLYRGLSCDGPPAPRHNDSFVSATFSVEVAESHFHDRDPRRTGVLLRQLVPVERLFMSYLETASMNAHYKEAEAVLLHDGSNPLF